MNDKKTGMMNIENRFRRMRFSLVLLPVFLLLSGCGNELAAPGADEYGNELVPVQVSAVVLSADVDGSDASQAPQTRATINTSGAKMGVFRVADNTKGIIAQNNVEYKYSSTPTPSWTAASGPILVGGLAPQICAYYPYGAATISGTTATLTAQKYDATKDLCYASNATAEVTNKVPTASFAMKRAYSRVTLSISRDATYSTAMGPCKINQLGFKPVAGTLSAVTSLDVSKEMSIQTAIASSGLLYNTVASDDINAGINVGASGSIDLLIPPTTVSAEMLLTVTVDGEARAVSIPAATLGMLVAGKQYDIRAKIVGLALLQLQAVTTINQDWSSIPTTPNGSFEEVKPQQ